MSIRFVELARQFRELDPNSKPEETALESYLRSPFSYGHELTWEDMLARRRVVLLAEAGSGKSREFQERAKILTEMGRFAFVVRLDQLADTSLESVLGPHESARLLTWRRGTGEGYFFLDSVDEAKFSRMTDFDSALNRFRDAVKDDLARAHIYLSSRITEWQPKSDASKVLSQLPMFPVLKKHSENQALMSHSSPADLRYTAWQGCACRSGVCDS